MTWIKNVLNLLQRQSPYARTLPYIAKKWGPCYKLNRVMSMHMADALISPAVGGLFWAASAFVTVKASKCIEQNSEDSRNVLMGVLAAFVFAAQMINFSIPGTGSSGHIGGGVLLAVLLGRERAFLSVAVILSVQALVFADGGLLALGCNIFNLGFLPCFVAYPLIYKKLVPSAATERRIFVASILTTVAALELGALFVVMQTVFSGITLIPPALFAALMLPMHLAIALAEGLATALIILYVYKNEPSLLTNGEAAAPIYNRGMKKTSAVVMVAALLVGGVFSWYASSQPDGLEWSLERAAEGWADTSPQNFFHALSSRVQEFAALLPDYSFKNGDDSRLGVSASGIIGSLATLSISAGLALFFGKRHSQR